jgi:hypothetical protein
MSLTYFKRRNNILPLAYYFQEPNWGLYNELMNNGNLISINGYRGFYMFKEGPYFECIDETHEAIDTYMNYYLLKFNSPDAAWPVTSLLPGDKHLIEQFKENGYEAWEGWQPDYLYFVYDK